MWDGRESSWLLENLHLNVHYSGAFSSYKAIKMVLIQVK